MHKITLLLIITLLFTPHLADAQGITGRVYDARSGEGLPFATIKFGEGGQGEVAGMDGKFTLPEGKWPWIEISCLG